MLDNLSCCTVCPHMCKVNRLENKVGRCSCNDKIKVALVSLHMFEEPCITGKNGSGTVFFSHCNLNCVYCQNYEISQLRKGKEISIQELADIFIQQQNKGAENINLVTPTMYVYQIIEAIKIAKANGLKIPIIYNSNGYENVDTIKTLNGFIDVYLPDLKYSDNNLAKEYSNINNYFEVATNAILEMYYQVGLPQFGENGLIKKGVLIRHLILPNHINNSKNVLNWIKNSLPNDVYVSIMAQYFPTYKAQNYALLNRKISYHELEEIKDYLSDLGIHNGYIQELGLHEEEYIPKFEIN